MRDDLSGGSFYDSGDVYETYASALDRGVFSPNLVMEEPAVIAAIGDPSGLRVLDLGCGNAALGPRLLAAGCQSYLGIDASAKMVAAARAMLQGTTGRVLRRPIETFTASPDSFDLVISRLALHYVEDLAAALDCCRGCLSPGGRMVFTVVHPVISSHDARSSTEEPRASWVVDEYFSAGPRSQDWLGGRVIWHHRTIEEYVAAFQRAGFALTTLSECAPQLDRFLGETAEFERRRRIPLFLLLAGRGG